MDLCGVQHPKATLATRKVMGSKLLLRLLQLV